MNKAELVKELSSGTGMKPGEAQHVLDSIVKVVSEALARNERITIRSSGSLWIAKRAARMGRNPQTGSALRVQARKVVKFRPNCPPPH